MPSFTMTRFIGLAALLVAAPAWAAGDMTRAEAACTAAAKARNLPVAGVEGMRLAGDAIEVSLRMTRGAPTLCRFDERTGGTSFPATAPAAPATPVASPSTRAAEVCAATAKQQGIRLGQLESVQLLGNGDFDVRYARPFFGKPQWCRYENARKTATFAGPGGPATLPAVPTTTDPKTAQEAGQACLTMFFARGMMEAQVASVKPVGGGVHEVLISFGGNPSGPNQRCRHNSQTGATEQM